MGVAARDLESGLMYERYLAALKRHGQPEDREPSPGHAIRQCARCGRATMHRLDPEGTWYECTRCGTYA